MNKGYTRKIEHGGINHVIFEKKIYLELLLVLLELVYGRFARVANLNNASGNRLLSSKCNTRLNNFCLSLTNQRCYFCKEGITVASKLTYFCYFAINL